ncbi:MAG: Competence protein A [candidate division BRC1 bacterium ADurb.BinA364]|nr:MAG: Competence protein A [candidate division BRC1 bacterium ADurb.BinA364]
MAGLKRCLGVDLGSSRIKVAEIQALKSGYRLLRLLQTDVDMPPGAPEDERVQRITQALRDLLKANKVGTKHAIFCLPGQSVFWRLVKLPKTNEERLLRIIEYEARQQIPFPLDQTHFEYQIFEHGPNPDEVEVLLVAVKRETVSNYMRAFRRSGLTVSGIGVSWLALFNYCQFDAGIDKAGLASGFAPPGAAADQAAAPQKKKSGFSFFGKKGKKAAKGAEQEPEEAEDDLNAPLDEEASDFGSEGLFGEVKAYVNLGANMMDLAIEKQGLKGVAGFCRSIPHAGSELTRAIQNALSLESFREAEDIKRKETVALCSALEFDGGATKHNPKASEALTQIVERRIIGELRRSLDFYISQPDGVAVDAIVLSGGQAALPYLASLIEEKMGVPVTVMEAPQNERLQLASGVEQSDWASGAMAVGLALQGVGATVIEIDFLPADLKTVQRFKGQYKEVAAMIALLGGMVFYSRNAGVTLEQKYLQAESEARRYVDQTTQNMLNTFAQVAAERQELAAKFETMSKVAADQDFWLRFLSDLVMEKPPEVVLDYVYLNSDGSVTIDGECTTIAPINRFQQNLAARTDLLTDAKIQNVVQVDDPYRRFPGNTGNKANYFRIAARHKDKIVRLRATPAPTLAPGQTPARPGYGY